MLIGQHALKPALLCGLRPQCRPTMRDYSDRVPAAMHFIARDRDETEPTVRPCYCPLITASASGGARADAAVPPASHHPLLA